MAYAQITAPGINSLTSIPGNFVNIVFGAGARTSATNVLPVVFIGDANGTSVTDGSTIYGADTTTPCRSFQDAQVLFGKSSELTQAARIFFATNTLTPAYFLPISNHTSLGTVTATVAGTAATITNTLNLFVNTSQIQVGISVGDTPTVIAKNAQLALNMLNREFTALATVGALAITAGSGGVGNTPKVDVVLAQADTGSGGISVSLGATTNGATGTLYAASIGAAITTLGSNKFYYQVLLSGSFDDAAVSVTANTVSFGTAIEALVSSINTQSLPLNDNRCRGFAGARMKSTDAIYATQFAPGSATTPGLVSKATVDSPRFEAVWAPYYDGTTTELIASYVAMVSLIESTTPVSGALNLNGMGLTTINGVPTSGLLKAPRSRYTESITTYNTALNAGVTCIGYKSGVGYLMRRVTTDAWDNVNGVAFFNIRDPHKVYVLDRFVVDLQAVLGQWMTGKLIGDDPIDSNAPIPPNTITPKAVRAGIINLINQYAGNALVQNAAQAISTMLIQRNPTVQTRMELKIQLVVADILNQMVTEVDQTG